MVLLLNYKISKFVYQRDKSKLPASFFNYVTLTKNIRSSRARANQSTIPFFKTQKTQRSIKYTGAKIWTSIPILIKKLCVKNLKKIIKKF